METPEVTEFSPCTVACPLHTDVQGYVSLIAQGRYADSLRLIKETNPLPSVLARICTHPCETKCRRGQVDQPIAICALKRVAVERGQTGLTPPQPLPLKEQRVAIIGSGPSGLTAAHDLAMLGYRVTVFEKQDQPGGILRYGIPLYRLPREELDRDISEIEKLGVEFKTGVDVGKELSLTDLHEQGYGAILIAVGLSLSRGLPIPGADLPGVYLALPFLADAAAGRCAFGTGKTVIVVGGGNVAFDVARSALRLGAGKVKMACLEARHEMPAWPWEIEEAVEEGIELNVSRGPKRILADDGKIVGLEMVEVKAVFDADGRFNPSFHEDRISSMEGDVVIIAIGQGSDLTLAKGTPVELTPRGLLVFQRDSMSTTQPGVFACGEVVTGPGAAVEAMANGRRASEAIHRYLSTGEISPVADIRLQAVGELYPAILGKIRKEERIPMPTLPSSERIKSLMPYEMGYDEEQAVQEAQRCLLCAVGARRRVSVCADCLTCVRSCPFGVPVASEQGVQIRLDQCQSCGICATLCPGKFITLQYFSPQEIMARVQTILKDGQTLRREGVLLAFLCRYHTASAQDHVVEMLLSEGIRSIELPCTARVDIAQLLAAFEGGADGVLLTVCDHEACHFREGHAFAQRTVVRVKDILDAVGLGGKRLELVQLPSPDGQALLSAVKRMAELGRSPVSR